MFHFLTAPGDPQGAHWGLAYAAPSSPAYWTLEVAFPGLARIPALPQSSSGQLRSILTPKKKSASQIAADMQQPGRGVHGHSRWEGRRLPPPPPGSARTRPDGYRPHHSSEKRQAGGSPTTDGAGPSQTCSEAVTQNSGQGRMQTESRDSFIAPWKVYLRGMSRSWLFVRWHGEGVRGCSHGPGKKKFPVSQAGALSPMLGGMGEGAGLACTSPG